MPGSGSVHSSTMALRYHIEEAPVASDDDGAAVASHTLTVAGVAIEDVTDEGGGDYSVNIDFDDDTLFNPALSGEFEVVITATNSRSPTPVTRRYAQPFVLDRTPPTIMFTTPDEGELIGGRTRVSASITDPYGVDTTTIVLRVGGESFAITFAPSIWRPKRGTATCAPSLSP